MCYSSVIWKILKILPGNMIDRYLLQRVLKSNDQRGTVALKCMAKNAAFLSSLSPRQAGLFIFAYVWLSSIRNSITTSWLAWHFPCCVSVNTLTDYNNLANIRLWLLSTRSLFGMLQNTTWAPEIFWKQVTRTCLQLCGSL